MNIQLKKSYKNDIKTDFHDEESPQEQSPCSRYKQMLINSVCKNDESYYP